MKSCWNLIAWLACSCFSKCGLILKTIFFCALIVASSLAAAQFTAVTGTVIDPNGLAYSNGTLTAVLSTSASPTLNGLAYTPPTQPVGLDRNGKFSLNLADNTQLSPAGTKWNFTVCSQVGATVQPAFGKGSVCFSLAAPITISGASQDISTQLQAVALALTALGGTTGGGGVGGGGASGQIAEYNGAASLAGAANFTDDQNGTLQYTFPSSTQLCHSCIWRLTDKSPLFGYNSQEIDTTINGMSVPGVGLDGQSAVYALGATDRSDANGGIGVYLRSGGNSGANGALLQLTGGSANGAGTVTATGANVNLFTTGSGAIGLFPGESGSSSGGVVKICGQVAVSICQLQLFATTAGSVTMQTPANFTGWTWTFPPNPGTNNYVMATDGTGVSTWQKSPGFSTAAGTLALPNGYMIEWGNTTADTPASCSVIDTVSVTWPTAFPTAALAAIISDKGSGDNTCAIGTLTTTGATAWVQCGRNSPASQPISCQFVAIGN